jgi:hypothetical protein
MHDSCYNMAVFSEFRVPNMGPCKILIWTRSSVSSSDPESGSEYPNLIDTSTIVMKMPIACLVVGFLVKKKIWGVLGPVHIVQKVGPLRLQWELRMLILFLKNILMFQSICGRNVYIHVMQ